MVIVVPLIVTPVFIPVFILAVVPVFLPVSGTGVMVHVVSGPAVPPVTVIDHATGHRTKRQNAQEYRRNEFLHNRVLRKWAGCPASVWATIFPLATGALRAVTYLA